MGTVNDKWIRSMEPTAEEEERMPTGVTEDGERLPACPYCGSIYFYLADDGECNACGYDAKPLDGDRGGQ